MCGLLSTRNRDPRRAVPRATLKSSSHYYAPEIEHVEVQACDACRRYLNVVRMHQAPDAIPDVDEIAALPLDVWAAENGYQKLVRNLVGI